MKKIILCCILAAATGCVSVQTYKPTSSRQCWKVEQTEAPKPSVCITSDSFSRKDCECLRKCLRKTNAFSKVLIGKNTSCDFEISCHKWSYSAGSDPGMYFISGLTCFILPVVEKGNYEYSIFVYRNGKIYSSVGLLNQSKWIGIAALPFAIPNAIIRSFSPEPETLFTSMLLDLKIQGAFENVVQSKITQSTP